MAALLVSVAVLAVTVLSFSSILRNVGTAVGWYLRKSTQPRRTLLLEKVATEEREYEAKKSRNDETEDDEWEKVESVVTRTAANGGTPGKEWKGIVGFFHPFCNAGGGGERVLWAAIRATQKRWPEAVCVVYTGDHDADKDSIIQRVQNRFNIPLHAPKLHFLYLSTRQYVLASTWPHFTLLGQSLGSLVLAYDAFSLLVPDIFLDTMGYAFSLWLGRMLFPSVPTGAYVHYPTISTDMLGSLDSDDEGTGVNAGQGTGLRGKVKRYYWHFFAYLYTQVGASIDLVMTNSSWTQMHIRSLWGAKRQATRRASSMKTPDDDEDITVVFPPVAVEELEHQVPVSPDSEKSRQRELLYIAQFRPEKNHTLIINAFAELMARWPDVADTPDNDDGRDKEKQRPHLTLIGSVRDDDDSRRVYKLRLQVYELKLKEHVTFITDASWAQILEALRRASVGVNAMWNEHFGIGVVEYQAAGLISVVHDSGGPKRDIVVDYGGGPTGFHATTPTQFAQAFHAALSLPRDETLQMRLRARESAKRFNEAQFARKWVGHLERLIALRIEREGKRGWTGAGREIGKGLAADW